MLNNVSADHGRLTNANRAIVEIVARYKLPAIYAWPDYVRAGRLASYGSVLSDA